MADVKGAATGATNSAPVIALVNLTLLQRKTRASSTLMQSSGAVWTGVVSSQRPWHLNRPLTAGPTFSTYRSRVPAGRPRPTVRGSSGPPGSTAGEAERECGQLVVHRARPRAASGAVSLHANQLQRSGYARELPGAQRSAPGHRLPFVAAISSCGGVRSESSLREIGRAQQGDWSQPSRPCLDVVTAEA